MFICKICGSEVRQGQAFCSKCGADVADNHETVCSACGSKNFAGSRYCAKCGGILPVISKPICAVCGAKNFPGAKFCVSCGAPVMPARETHSDADLMEIRHAKLKIDTMERERMAAVDKEIAEKRKRIDEEKKEAIKEADDYRDKINGELDKQSKLLDAYRRKLNELGAEDVALLKKMSKALKDYSVYYADPYSMFDEDDIDGETYVCPACGTVNPLNVTACTHCGRNKARATLLLAKGKIKQSPPVKRKKDVILPPDEDLDKLKTPTYDEFVAAEQDKKEAPEEAPPAEEKKEQPQDFSGRGAYQGGYPYLPYGYPYPAYPAAPQPAPFAPQFYGVDNNGEPYQMPPIVQPVAFVPYVTQDQPVMQYAPADDSNK